MKYLFTRNRGKKSTGEKYLLGHSLADARSDKVTYYTFNSNHAL